MSWSRAPQAAPAPTGRRLLTVTWEIPAGISAERATALAEQWAAGELATEGSRLPPPRQVAVTDATPEPGETAGAQLARRRAALGLTQAELARRAGISRQAVNYAERHQQHLTGSRVVRAIRRALQRAEAAR